MRSVPNRRPADSLQIMNEPFAGNFFADPLLRESGVSRGLTPLQNCLFTPELQWQSRGKWRTLQGCQLETLGVGVVFDALRAEGGRTWLLS